VNRVRVVAVFVVFALTLASGCTRASFRQGENASNEPFTFTQQWEPRSLNPALENGDSSQEWGLLLFSYLVKYDSKGGLVPDVATVVPTKRNGGISPDGRTITYHLRHGVRFSDGTPLTAQDAAWSIDAINDPNNDVQSRYGYDDVKSARAVSRYTLVLRLKRPFAPLISIVLAPQGYPIFPKHALTRYRDFNQNAFNQAPIGSGPYVVKEWIRSDKVELVQNPYYWAGRPGIARITIRFVADAQTSINMLEAHEAQGFYDDQSQIDMPVLEGINGYRVTRRPPQQNGVGALIFNTQDPLTSDPRVRHALAEAIDIKAMIDKTYRGAEESHDPGRGLFLWAYDPKAYPDVPYDPAQSRALLRAAGWRMGKDGWRRKGGRTMSLLLVIQAATPGNEIIGDNIVQYERAAGVKVTLKAFNITQFVAPAQDGGPVYGGKFQMALYPFENGADPDTTDQFACKNVPPNGFNKSRLCDRRVDALLAAGRATYNVAKRKAIYARLQRLLYAQMPIALLYQTREIDTWTTRLHVRGGAQPQPFANVARWYLASRRQVARSRRP
jgi:peptide/nickel transport system substrate-binding protein